VQVLQERHGVVRHRRSLLRPPGGRPFPTRTDPGLSPGASGRLNARVRRVGRVGPGRPPAVGADPRSRPRPPRSGSAYPLRHLESDAPALPNLKVYDVPEPGKRYVLGADPAEGNPTSDDSALSVHDADTGEQVAALAGKYDPAVFASTIRTVSGWYNDAPAMV